MSPKDKEILDRIHSKYYRKGSKAHKENAKIIKIIKEKGIKVYVEGETRQVKTSAPQAPGALGEAIKAGIGIVDQAPKAGSRAELMAEAQKRGIKYFRILTKEELTEIINNPKATARIAEIIKYAKARWQAGWSKEKKNETAKS